MKRWIRIYGVCMKSAFSKAAAYRADFMFSMIVSLIGNLLFPYITVVIYHAGASFPGWSFYEVLLLQAIFTMSNGIATMLYDGVLWVTMDHIREGSFEVVLLKPLNPLFYLMATTFHPEAIGLIIGGLVLFLLAIVHIGGITVIGWLGFVLFFLGGIAVMTGIAFIMAATSFKWVGNSRIPEIADSIKNFGKYPITIFPKTIRLITTYLIPVGLIGFLPASALLNRVTPISILAVGGSVIFMLFGIGLYLYMIGQYEGVGG